MQSNQQEGTLTMLKTVLATVTIQFTDGTTQCFEFEAPEIDPMTSASRLEKLLVRKQLQIHLSTGCSSYPWQASSAWNSHLFHAFRRTCPNS